MNFSKKRNCPVCNRLISVKLPEGWTSAVYSKHKIEDAISGIKLPCMGSDQLLEPKFKLV